MSDFKGILRLTRTQFNTLKQNGTLTVGSKVITYDPLTTFYTSLDDMFLSDYLDLTTNQTINGQKTFSDVLKVNGNVTTDNAVDLGTADNKFGNIYANKFVGNLEGNVTGSMSKKLILQTSASTTSNYDGSTDVTLSNYYVDRFTNQTVNGNKTFVNDATFNGSVVIGGNLTVTGTTTSVDSTTLKVKDKLIEVAKDNTVALTTPAGLLAPKYDGVNYGALGFDATGTAYVGDVFINENGDIDVSNASTTWQPIATRENTPNDKSVAYWDASTLKFITNSDVKVINGEGIRLAPKRGITFDTGDYKYSIYGNMTNQAIFAEVAGVGSEADQYKLLDSNGKLYSENHEVARKDYVGTGTLTMQFNGDNVDTFSANASANKTINIKALPNYSLSIGSTNDGNPRQVKFISVNYTNFDSNNGAYFKLGAMECHGNGQSYAFLEDIIIGVSYTGTVSCNVYKYVQAETTLDSVTRNYGDVFYTIDTTNKVVDFYILMGQYSSAQFTPGTKIGATKAVTSANGIVQYTGTPTYYSSGDKIWATGNSTTYARLSDLDNYVTTDTEQTISAVKKFKVPTVMGQDTLSIGEIDTDLTNDGAQIINPIIWRHSRGKAAIFGSNVNGLVLASYYSSNYNVPSVRTSAHAVSPIIISSLAQDITGVKNFTNGMKIGTNWSVSKNSSGDLEFTYTT